MAKTRKEWIEETGKSTINVDIANGIEDGKLCPKCRGELKSGKCTDEQCVLGPEIKVKLDKEKQRISDGFDAMCRAVYAASEARTLAAQKTGVVPA